MSNNSNSDYLSALSVQIGFLKLYFSPLIRTPIECINKPMLIDVNRFNKTISTYSRKKFYDNRNTWNLIKTAIIVIFSITSYQRLPNWLLQDQYKVGRHRKWWYPLTSVAPPNIYNCVQLLTFSLFFFNFIFKKIYTEDLKHLELEIVMGVGTCHC